MRIVVLANPASTHTRRWALAYAEAGHEVHVVGIRPAEIPGVEVHHVGWGGNGALRSLLSYLWLLLSVRRRMRGIDPDVLHAHYSVTHGAIAVIARLRPVVLTVWGTDLVVGDRPVRGPKRWLNRFVLRRVDAVTGASRFLVDAVRRVAGEVAVHQVPFGVDTRKFRPSTTPPAGLVVGWVKALRERYDPEMALGAFRMVADEVPGSRLVVAGDGPMRLRLEQTVAGWGLSDRVAFAGAVPHTVLPDLMQEFSVLVNSSRSESFGVVLLEGAACGLPVVATRVGGVPEVVEDGSTGMLVPVGDSDAMAAALVGLAKDPDLARSMGEAGRELVSARYEWSECISVMLRVLAGVAR